MLHKLLYDMKSSADSRKINSNVINNHQSYFLHTYAIIIYTLDTDALILNMVLFIEELSSFEVGCLVHFLKLVGFEMVMV